MRAKKNATNQGKKKMYCKIVELDGYVSLSALNERLNTSIKRQIL